MPCDQPSSTEQNQAAASQDDATDRACDTLASAEEASLRGEHAHAAYLMHQAEQIALHSGSLSLITFVWRHTPTTPATDFLEIRD